MWCDVLAIEELPQGHQRCRNVNGRKLLLLHTEKGLYALENRCPHADFPLYGGRVEANAIRCPSHGARFNLDDGEPLQSSHIGPAKTYPVMRRDGRVLVQIDEDTSGSTEW
ncbi:Rieske (2Fe-2S) protein [Marinobacter salarius]|uniref:Rieske (2Fe-2S) protein n=1 Tax=Marinobacter salarius TaxID=1420917 RepID=UPI0032F01745